MGRAQKEKIVLIRTLKLKEEDPPNVKQEEKDEEKEKEEVVEALALEVTRSLLRRPRRFPAQEESPLPE